MNYNENQDFRQVMLRMGAGRCPMTRGEVSEPDGEEMREDCLAGRSLAMVYSPYQAFQNLYDPAQGLCAGTIFIELDKPFLGAGRAK